MKFTLKPICQRKKCFQAFHIYLRDGARSHHCALPGEDIFADPPGTKISN